MNFSHYFILGSTGLVGIFAWELVARKRSSNKKPSVALNWLATLSRSFFTGLGERVAWLSSYLTIVDLHDVWATLSDLAEPAAHLVASPFSFFCGYWKMAQEYKYPLLVCLGSALALGVGTYFGRKFGVTQYLPSLRSLPKLR